MRPNAPVKRPIWSVLQNKNFRTIWYVGSLGEVGRRMELFVLSWLILQLTDSYFQLGLVFAFNNLPRPLVSLYTGYIADRFPRAKVLMTGQIINVLTAVVLLGVMAYDFELIKPWHVFGAVFIQGITKSIEDPSRRTAIFDIVGQQRLVNALSLDVISHNLGKMAGPILAGILLDVTGFTGAYSVLLGVHLFNLALMTQMRIPNYQGQAQIEPIIRSMKVAISYAWRSPVLVGLFYITIIMNTLAFPFQQFIPAIGRDQLEVGVVLVGLLVAADGFGQLAGAGIMALTRDLQLHGRFFVLGCIGVLFVGMVFVWSPWYVMTFVLLTLGGIAQSGFATMQSAITMLTTPQAMRGRMMGLLSVFIGVGTPVGATEIGLVASSVSVQWAISLNMFAGLVLLVPAIFLTPLAWKPIAQAETGPELIKENVAAEISSRKSGDINQ